MIKLIDLMLGGRNPNNALPDPGLSSTVGLLLKNGTSYIGKLGNLFAILGTMKPNTGLLLLQSRATFN